jgi:hypothetical protein
MDWVPKSIYVNQGPMSWFCQYFRRKIGEIVAL